MAAAQDSFRSPLGRVRGLGSARGGTGHWWAQRVTALALIPLSLVFLVLALRLVGDPHADAAAALGHPFAAGIALLLVGALFWHLKLGLQVVIEDYVHSGWAVALQLAQSFACAALALACALALLKLVVERWVM